MQSRERLYAFDNLRAVMMWLGIVLHAADLHLVGPPATPWHDSQTSPVADLLTALIHTFRMPVFFIVAGFFVWLLAERRGVTAMLAHRARRIGLPFLIFWPVLFAVSVRLATLYAEKRGTRVEGLFDLRTMPLLADGTRFQTLHLWFLELLMGLIVIAAAGLSVSAAIPARVRERIARLLEWSVSQWWAFLPMSLVLACISNRQESGVMRASALFAPPLSEWIFNGLFFGFGLVLYRARERLLPRFQALCLPFALGGTAAFFLATIADQMVLRDSSQSLRAWLWVGVPYNASSWLWACALVGMFSRYCNAQSVVLRYLSDSSYWVYLVHLPVLVALEYLVLDEPIPALLKMLMSIAITTLVSLLSYQLFVRGTALGRLLGESAREPRRSDHPAPAAGERSEHRGR